MISKLKLFVIALLLSQLSLANKPDIFLLKTYEDSQDVVGWVMSEKFDGIRGFWTGEKLISRSGNEFNPPVWFTKDYPPFPIDGELWTKRSDFENISSIIRSQDSGDRWHQVTHNIFEVPNQQGGLFDRLSILKSYLDLNPILHLKIIPQKMIDNKQQLQDFLQEVTANKGEGVVVRNPKTPYQTGRLSSALKLKKYFDTECIVLEILEGKGKYTGKMGSVLCQTHDNITLKVGSGFKDKDRENPPEIGSEITFKYYGFTKKGKHKYPVYLRTKPSN